MKRGAGLTLRQRKLAGIFACIAFLTVYCLVVMALAAELVVGAHGLVEFTFFVLAGFAWLPVVMLIIRWMSRPD